ncbi:hypothetical protein DOZ80_10560 [Pseudomonas fluorescens]|uniref:Uncharacterized protein n=1 Tax=Pseudomonas fluorescens TaxID=294 RepID=A0A327N7C1_PSEFL|nr:hypothetical protein [Pseudomonas fluorescens]RAI70902.1 hypothetical protein DOZ80_10560 [Pseudomonas fluorescens]
MAQSPFKTHRHLLVTTTSATGERMREFVLSLYNDNRFLFRAASIRHFDEVHMAIFLELAQSFNEHGLNDPEFVSVCMDVINQYETKARKNYDELIALRSVRPAPSGIGAEDHALSVKDCEERYEIDQEKGYIR